jgi:hypothetical protein
MDGTPVLIRQKMGFLQEILPTDRSLSKKGGWRLRPWSVWMVSTRDKLLLAGLLAFLVGVQFRVVDSFILNERSTHFVAARLGGPEQALAWQAPPLRKVVEPPRWLGLALMSVGAVLTVKSLSLKHGG